MGIQRDDRFKTHRLIFIDKWIRSGTYPSVGKMMDEYGVSRRTIMRDLEFLRERYEAPLAYDKIRGGYYYTDPTFMVQNVLLTETDLFTISTVMPLMEQYKNTPLESSFKNIMTKLSEMLPDKVVVDSCFLNKDVSFISDPLPKIEESVFENIFKAVKLHQVICLSYRNLSSQEYKEKIFDCYRVLCQKGNWYVFGFDHAANAPRILALSRIKDIQFNGSFFTIPEDFDVNKHIDLSFGIWNNPEEPVEYEILFSSELNTYIQEREWHKNQTMELKEDGSVLLKFKSNQKQTVLSWILGFGNAVTVLNPPSLRDEIRASALKLLEKYKE